MHNKNNNRQVFTKKMKKAYRVLLPSMLPIHFRFLQGILNQYGYDAELLEYKDTNNIIEEGLRYVNNDVCYPALLVIGQFITALKSRKYNLGSTALLITQTGGGCRASNYIHLLRKALVKAGFAKVPVISLNLSGLEKNPGFKITFQMIKKMIFALALGDVLMTIENSLTPYGFVQGEVLNKINKWVNFIFDEFTLNRVTNFEKFKNILNFIIKDFSKIHLVKKNVTKVGIVGEIYIKYSELGNNNLVHFLQNNECEVCVPGIMNFILFKVDNRLDDIKIYGGNVFKKIILSALMSYLEKIESITIRELSKFNNLKHLSSYKQKKKAVNGIVGYGNKMGEGWLLTAEIIDLVKTGYNNIVCVQPFGCLPNHISGKGMLRKVKDTFKEANIIPIDYDPGASKTNQENRLNLMLALARGSGKT